MTDEKNAQSKEDIKDHPEANGARQRLPGEERRCAAMTDVISRLAKRKTIQKRRSWSIRPRTSSSRSASLTERHNIRHTMDKGTAKTRKLYAITPAYSWARPPSGSSRGSA